MESYSHDTEYLATQNHHTIYKIYNTPATLQDIPGNSCTKNTNRGKQMKWSLTDTNTVNKAVVWLHRILIGMASYTFVIR